MPTTVDASTARVQPDIPLTILVIEDDFEYSQLLNEALMSRGHHVIAAPNHDVAREKIAEHDINLIMSDGATASSYKDQTIDSLGVLCSGSAFFKDGEHVKDGKPIPAILMSGGTTGSYNDEMLENAQPHGGAMHACSKNELYEVQEVGQFNQPTAVKLDVLDKALAWAQEQQAAKAGPLDVLIMEDCEYHSASLKEALKARGHNVTAVTTHMEGRDLLREGKRFDLAFSDGSTQFGCDYTADTFLDENETLDNPIPTIGMSDNRTSVRKMGEYESVKESVGKFSFFGNYGGDIYDEALDKLIDSALNPRAEKQAQLG